MKILVGCEFSGVVRNAFSKKGHYAISCDLLPSKSPGNHYWGNLLDILDNDWDLCIFHPECTYLCNSGVRWLDGNDERYRNMVNSAKFFRKLLNSKCPKICVENPIPHKYALAIIGRKYDQIIQPWQYGHGETKATCLWLKGVPLLTPTSIVEGRADRIHKMPPSPDRWKLRSTTYQGIADAMAIQWGFV
jgi:hypothetical protein